MSTISKTKRGSRSAHWCVNTHHYRYIDKNVNRHITSADYCASVCHYVQCDVMFNLHLRIQNHSFSIMYVHCEHFKSSLSMTLSLWRLFVGKTPLFYPVLAALNLTVLSFLVLNLPLQLWVDGLNKRNGFSCKASLTRWRSKICSPHLSFI